MIDYIVLTLCALYWLNLVGFSIETVLLIRCIFAWRVGIGWAFAIWCMFYALTGLCMGTAFKVATPAMTWRGVAYIAAIWPAWQMQELTGVHPPIPDWTFDFSPWN